MEKERLKLPYEEALVDVLKFAVGDIITTSGDDTLTDGDGPVHESDGWV